MNKEDVVKKIEEELLQKRNKVVRKNIILSALSLFSNPVQSIEKLYFGVNNDLSNEKLKIEQDIILDLICQISNSFESMLERINSNSGKNAIIIDGLIELKSSNTKKAVGVEINENSGQVELKPGTKIGVETNNTEQSIALKIGGKE